MRKFAALAAMAAMFFAAPAYAQAGGGKAKPEAEALTGVSADASRYTPPAILPADPENTWVLDLSSGGRVTIRLRPDVAPKMVAQIKTLTRQKYYDGVIFHRVIDGGENMAQGGDRAGNGTGNSDLPNVDAEFSNLPHVRGAVSAARKGAPQNATPEQKTEAHNSANSQFFIMFGPRLGFDHDYTVFGRVNGGMQWVDKIQRGEPPANPTRILHAYIQSDNPPPYQAPVASEPVLPAGETKASLIP